MKTHQRCTAVILTILLLLGASPTVKAQPVAGPPGEYSWVATEVLLPCRVMLPADYDPAREYPLVVGLHGFGSSLERFASAWYAFAEPQFIFAVPLAPYSVPQEDYPGYSWFPIDSSGFLSGADTLPRARQQVLDVVASVKTDYSISGTYLLGFSQGTMLAYYTALSMPDEFAGIGVLAGWFEHEWLPKEVLEAAVALPVFAACGTEDSAQIRVLHHGCVDVLSQFGYAVESHDFAGGHTFTSDILREFQRWLTEN